MSRIITQPELNLTRGLLALLTIILFESVIGWLVMRGTYFAKIFQKEPVLLAFRGEILESQLQRYSVHRRKIYQALRVYGFADPAQVGIEFAVLPWSDVFLSQAECIVLEPNGAISVARRLVDEWNEYVHLWHMAEIHSDDLKSQSCARFGRYSGLYRTSSRTRQAAFVRPSKVQGRSEFEAN